MLLKCKNKKDRKVDFISFFKSQKDFKYYMGITYNNGDYIEEEITIELYVYFSRII